MAFIVSLIAAAIQETLEEAFAGIDDYSGSDLVRLGRLMDDPEGYENPICVHENDPEDPNEWLHQQATEMPGYRSQWMPYGTREIGGGEVWVRRFTVELNIYLTREGLEREAAKGVMDTVHGRAHHALKDSKKLQGIIDDYGEIVWLSAGCVVRSRMVLSGGPPSSWIGRGKLWLQVWTEIPG